MAGSGVFVPYECAIPAAQARLRFIEFQQPTLVETPPDGDGWIHEIKYDEYRTELVIQNGKARAFTRRGFDWSDKYGPIVEQAAALQVKSAIIDGEVIVLNDNNVSDFSTLRSTIRWQPERLIYVAFDLMHLDGEDLRFKAAD
jgi:bifunctional non-homologous end joining protein LigD